MPRKTPAGDKPAGKRARPRKEKKQVAPPQLASGTTHVTELQDAPVVDLVEQPHGGALRRGNPGNKGGGRKPDWFKQAARDALEVHDVIPMLGRIAAGLEGEIRHVKLRGPDGDTLVKVCTEASLKDRREAAKTLVQMGVGFSNEVVGEDGGPLTIVLAAAKAPPPAAPQLPPATEG